MKKNMKFLIILFAIFFFNSNLTFAAMSGGSDSDKLALYKQGKKLVYKAKKLESEMTKNIFKSLW